MVRVIESSSRRDERRELALTQSERVDTIRAAWNDGAWGRCRRSVPDRLASLYERGYQGGLKFRRRDVALAK